MMISLRHRFWASLDLISRYRAAWNASWSRRHELSAVHYTSLEASFLPGALALQETPPSPVPRVLMWVLITMLLATLGWSILGRIEIVAAAQGKVVGSARTKVIQPSETAVVRRIAVSEGQAVKAGDVLVELDSTIPTAEGDQVVASLQFSRLRGARASALLASIDSGRLHPIPDSIAEAEALREANRWLQSEFEGFRAQLTQANAETAKRTAELASVREGIKRLEATVPLIQQRADDLNRLLERGYVSKHTYLEKEQQRKEQEGELSMQRSRFLEVQASLEASCGAAAALVAEARRKATEEMQLADRDAADLARESRKASAREELMKLTAPVGGTVQQLAIHTVGGVVTPAQVLMMIVPTESAVEIEAFLENKDVGFVQPGMPAEVKIEAFPFTKYGVLHGSIVSVSHDAVEDEKRGLIFLTRVALKTDTIRVGSADIRITPGMAVTVEAKTGTRRAIEYFLSPLQKYQDETLDER